MISRDNTFPYFDQWYFRKLITWCHQAKASTFSFAICGGTGWCGINKFHVSFLCPRVKFKYARIKCKGCVIPNIYFWKGCAIFPYLKNSYHNLKCLWQNASSTLRGEGSKVKTHTYGGPIFPIILLTILKFVVLSFSFFPEFSLLWRPKPKA